MPPFADAQRQVDRITLLSPVSRTLNKHHMVTICHATVFVLTTPTGVSRCVGAICSTQVCSGKEKSKKLPSERVPGTRPPQLLISYILTYVGPGEIEEQARDRVPGAPPPPRHTLWASPGVTVTYATPPHYKCERPRLSPGPG
ncbi:hypothetical protein Bbelb_208680 [Branchiostoma belcheri]|nr:hypothetical protein Bbelb_208680 [Branchiostoma belcheri]